MVTPTICVLFSDTHKGLLALGFAGDLVRRMKLDSLLVYLRDDANATPIVGSPDNALHVIDTHHQRVLDRVMAITGLTASRITLTTFLQNSEPVFPPDALVVNHSMGRRIVPAWVLVPFEEEWLGCRGPGPILLPFGNDDTGPRSAQAAVTLSRMLGCDLVFYHTTWLDPDQKSTNPEDHVCAAAVGVRKELEQMSTDGGVRFTTIVQATDDVVRGILRCAMETGASLIVSRRGRKVEIGSYLTQLLEQSPVPLLVRR